MYTLRSKSLRVLALLVLAFVMAVATYGFAAANTFEGGSDAGSLGEGSGTISGYNVTNITYTVDTSNPSSISVVDFTLDAAASTVKAAFNGGAWIACTSAGGNNWTCNISSTVENATTLDVFASE
ncbi:MAG: hypothetical protein H8D34_00480 [Chloroflexi bacterium]|nr:hypothetical protein [Chloroflexota bacterium]